MKIRMRYVLPALVMLAGCAATKDSGYSASNAEAPAMAPPQRVDAVSNAVGAKMDGMLASQPATNNGVMR